MCVASSRGLAWLLGFTQNPSVLSYDLRNFRHSQGWSGLYDLSKASLSPTHPHANTGLLEGVELGPLDPGSQHLTRTTCLLGSTLYGPRAISACRGASHPLGFPKNVHMPQEVVLPSQKMT